MLYFTINLNLLSQLYIYTPKSNILGTMLFLKGATYYTMAYSWDHIVIKSNLLPVSDNVAPKGSTQYNMAQFKGAILL